VGLGIVLSPIFGLLISYVLTVVLAHLLKRHSEKRLNKAFKGLQLASSALLSLTHGGNDAQKTMGIIAVLLFSTSWLEGEFYVPFWVVISCHAVISLGTLFGGWRIVKTLGTQITKLNTFTGCTAETGAAAMIYACTEFSVPVSTTQTVTGSVTGVGLANGWNQTHWPILRKIFAAWVLTLPAAGIIAALVLILLK
jgi:PiT family inorganic phosphate transporter